MMARLGLSLALCLGLAACAPDGGALRAVGPTLDRDTVVKASADRQSIMNALIADASVGAPGGVSWYDTTLAGFNFVDDQCSAYFDSLFRLDRNRRATVSGIGAFGQTTNAILAATDGSAMTIALVAQAFGLASSMTEIVAGSFLYQLPPATTRDFVSTAMRAYRNGVSQVSGEIDNAALSYGYIRGYLDLCLPVTIEGMLVDTISSTQAVAGTGGGGAIEIGLSSVSATAAVLQRPGSVDDALAPVSEFTLTAPEQLLSSAEWREIQTYLCVSADGRPGPQTREAIAAYFDGLGAPNPAIAVQGASTDEIVTLQTNIAVNRQAGRLSCQARQVANAFEAGDQDS
jgi:hypothetical protein